MRMIFALLAALVVAIAFAAPSVTPSSAQKMGNEKAKEAPKKKSTGEEKDYKAAVDRLPDQKFDPWRNIR
jgi:hypothetical protein